MTDALIMLATIVVAFFWTGYLQWRLSKAEGKLASVRVTLVSTKETNEALDAEVQLLKTILTDVAKGEAHVWIEDGEVRAVRGFGGKASVH